VKVAGMPRSVPSLMVFTLEISELVACAEEDNDETPSSRRLFQQSTRRPKWERKSTPVRGCVTSATTNRHVKSWSSPRLRDRDRDGSAVGRAEFVVEAFPAPWNEHAEV
jgi:hypothetical protein